jgi:hypothetical protein
MSGLSDYRHFVQGHLHYTPRFDRGMPDTLPLWALSRAFIVSGALEWNVQVEESCLLQHLWSVRWFNNVFVLICYIEGSILNAALSNEKRISTDVLE